MTDYQRVRVLRTDLLAKSAEPAADVRDNIVEILNSSGLDLQDLARRTDVSRPSLLRAVSGEHVPTARILVAVADGLGCDASDLLRVRRPASQDTDTYATVRLRVPVSVLKELIREGIITNG